MVVCIVLCIDIFNIYIYIYIFVFSENITINLAFEKGKSARVVP